MRYKAVGEMEGVILHDYEQRGFSCMEMVWEAIEGRAVVEKLFDWPRSILPCIGQDMESGPS
ncbi:hypothetical protein NW756_009316 [Fusarium oxysporum]|nr:hypothetical protein NW763_012202 [Fusarium oxysporum]KAJ4084450.1 hypothetical protein NW756_009316 [Fusarium oxysporum]KAJ4226900.1 hypothetical protein NW760_008965 [Fusarium oxysporum]